MNDSQSEPSDFTEPLLTLSSGTFSYKKMLQESFYILTAAEKLHLRYYKKSMYYNLGELMDRVTPD